MVEPILRIMTIRLTEKIQENKEYAGKLGIEDVSHYRTTEKTRFDKGGK